MVTMNAGNSINQKRIGAALIVALLLLWASSASAQTGQALSVPKFAAYDSNGDPCASCKVFAYVSGTTTKQDTYTSSTLGTPNANPVVLDSAGRATIYIDPTKTYKFVLAPSTDSDPPASALWSVDPVTGQFSGTVTITAAATRGLQISRSGANAGMSIASTGGSGKTYGFVSDTSGALLIQDDADSTPQIKLSGNDITQTATGTLSWPSGLASFGGFGAHLFSSSGTGANSLVVRNTTAGVGNYAELGLGNDATLAAFRISHTSTTYTASGAYQQDASVINGARSGGLSLAASNASGALRLYSGNTLRATIQSNGGIGIGTSSTSFDLELRSTADDLSGGQRISRSDGSYFNLNMNDGGSTAAGILQAGDNGAYRPTSVSPSGGGMQVGGGTAFLSVISNTASWDIPSKLDGSMEAMTLTMTGVQATSPCFVGFWPNTGGTTWSGFLLSAYYDSANTVRVVAMNKTGSTADPTSATVRVTCFTY